MAAHAKLSASGAERWLTCPGSIKAEESIPDKSSKFAMEGTAAHELAELCLTSTGLAKNPNCSIVQSAVALCVGCNTAVEHTIRNCTDITQFVTVRRVTGGAVWESTYLGKAVRFYYSTEVPKDACIHYAKNSNRVPMSGGAKPLMTLPESFPLDVDYDVYVQMAHELLLEIGYVC